MDKERESNIKRGKTLPPKTDEDCFSVFLETSNFYGRSVNDTQEYLDRLEKAAGNMLKTYCFSEHGENFRILVSNKTEEFKNLISDFKERLEFMRERHTYIAPFITPPDYCRHMCTMEYVAPDNEKHIFWIQAFAPEFVSNFWGSCIGYHYTFTEEAYDKIVEWLNEQGNGNKYHRWEQISAICLEYQGIFNKWLMVEETLEKLENILKLMGNSKTVPQEEKPVDDIATGDTEGTRRQQQNAPQADYSKEKYWNNLEPVFSLYPRFKTHFPILVENRYILADGSKETLVWNDEKASLADLGRYFNSIRPKARSNTSWLEVKALFGNIPTSTDLNKLATNKKTSKKFGKLQELVS